MHKCVLVQPGQPDLLLRVLRLTCYATHFPSLLKVCVSIGRLLMQVLSLMIGVILCGLLQGSVRITVSVPNVDEGNLKGQLLEITVQSLSESVGSLKEKIAGEIQLPANKQKLSGKAGFLKDNLSLAYYNVGGGEMLSLSLRERGGRKR